jgi:GNAT superfamily N-acetyltransferase
MAGSVRRGRRLIYVELRLRDGRSVRIRAIEAADAELLREFDAGLSETSRQLRYLGWMPPLSVEKAARWATVDFRERFALVAVARQGERERIVADCRLVPLPERPCSLEVAIAVADDFQDAGLGRALLKLILGIASARSVEVLARVRYDNRRMMHLLPGLGFRRIEWELGVVTFVRPPDGLCQADVWTTSRSRAEIVPA